MLPDRLCRLLTAHVDGELSAREQETVLELLRGSPEARVFLQRLQDDANQLRSLPAHKLEPGFTDRVMDQVNRATVRPVLRYNHPAVATQLHIGIGLATAAAMLLVIGLGSVYLLKKGNTPAPVAEAPGPQLADVTDRDPANHNRVGAGEDDFPSAPLRPKEMPAEVASPRSRPLVEKAADEQPQPRSPSSNSNGVVTTPNAKTPPIHPATIQVALDFQPFQEQTEWQQKLLEKLHTAKTQRLEFECRQTILGMKTLQGALEAEGIGLLVDKRADSELQAFDLRLPSTRDYAIYAENLTAEEVLRIVQKIGDRDRAARNRHLSPLFNAVSVKSILSTNKEEVKEATELLGFNPLDPAEARPSGKINVRKPLADDTTGQVLKSLKGRRPGRPEGGRAGGRLPDRLALVVAGKSHSSPANSREIQFFIGRRQPLQSDRLQILLFLRRP
jgi:hypothetical protein